MNFIVFTIFSTVLDKYLADEGFTEGSNALIRCIEDNDAIGIVKSLNL